MPSWTGPSSAFPPAANKIQSDNSYR
jgi:hypothetical protein